MWFPWKSKRRDQPETVRAHEPEPEFVQISSTPDLSEVPFAELREDPHSPDVPDPRDRFLYLDFGFDGRIPVGVDLGFPSGQAADPEEILSQSQALLDAGLAFAARQLLAQLTEPALSSAKACWLAARLLWRRFSNIEERSRRGWGTDFLSVPSTLQLQEAEKLLRSAIEKDPTFGEAWLSLAQVHLEPGCRTAPSQAAAEALQACRLLGDAPAALLTLGRALRAAGRPGDAIAAFERIPEDAESRAAAKPEMELAQLEARCLAEPIDVAAHLALGRWCLLNGRADRAHELFTQLAVLDRAEGLYGLGRLALIEPGKDLGERQSEARRLALAALSRDPQLGLAHELLGLVQSNLREDPILHYRRAVELDSTCDHALLGLAEDHVERGEIEPAIARLEAAVRLETPNAFSYRLLALLYECTHRDDQLDHVLTFRRKGDELDPHTELSATYINKVRRLCNFEL